MAISLFCTPFTSPIEGLLVIYMLLDPLWTAWHDLAIRKKREREAGWQWLYKYQGQITACAATYVTKAEVDKS